ncbi:hypothetical protein EP331_06465 [bacterium]|nr:MAG: hypothetical protein EP331_06465 [bacterium]
MKIVFAILLYTTACFNLSNAQETTFKTIPEHLKPFFNEQSLSISGPLSSTGMRFIAKTGEGSLYHIRVSYNRFLLGVDDWLFYYHANAAYVYDLKFYNKYLAENLETKGITFAPFGAQLVYSKWKYIQPLTRLIGGFVYYFDYFPDSRGAKLNFTYELDLGINVALYKSVKLYTGYTFFHHSNAELASTNPGMDNNMFVMGIGLDF